MSNDIDTADIIDLPRLSSRVKHFKKLADMHAKDHSPAKAEYYRCKAEIVEHQIEIEFLKVEGRHAMQNAGYEGYDFYPHNRPL
jgi:hypothetical protein